MSSRTRCTFSTSSLKSRSRAASFEIVRRRQDCKIFVPLTSADLDPNKSDKQDDSSRTQQAKQVVEEYVRDLRELIKKFRGKMN